MQHSPKVMLFILVFAATANAQVTIRGVFTEKVKSYEAGDTAQFYGAREDAHSKRLYYFLKGSGSQVISTKVRLLTDEVSFWELQQFYYTSREITETGWQTQKRNDLNSRTLDYIARLESDGKLYNDRFAEDFLQQTIQKIHYPKIHKGKDYFISIKIVNAERKFIYAFDNGAILISTQIIAESKSYSDLLTLLTRAIAHIVLNSNIEMEQYPSSSELKELGAVYPEADREKKKIIAENFIKYTNRTKPGSLDAEPGQYMASIAGIISYTAWQAYYSKEYTEALKYITRLEEQKLENSTDLLLKAKCYMEISNTAESNELARDMLLRATAFKDEFLPEVYAELGLVLLRLNNYADAKTAYIRYQELISCTDETDKKTWARKMIKACNYYIEKEQESNSANSDTERVTPANTQDIPEADSLTKTVGVE